MSLKLNHFAGLINQPAPAVTFGARKKASSPAAPVTAPLPSVVTPSPLVAAPAVESPASGLVTLTQDQVTFLMNLAKTRTVTYRKEFQAAIDEVKKYLETYLKDPANDPKKSAVVMDLDETLFDNSSYHIQKPLGMMKYFDWNRKGEASAIPETKELVDWVLSKGFQLYFVTARKDFLEKATISNLEKIGYKPGDYAGLYLKPQNHPGSSAAHFKVEAQEAIAAKGLKVIAMIGDQDSDLAGCLGRGFKLPNPLYTVD
jgi:predicted secreted acid phosphatase